MPLVPFKVWITLLRVQPVPLILSQTQLKEIDTNGVEAMRLLATM
jgi:hypothetical protein